MERLTLSFVGEVVVVGDGEGVGDGQQHHHCDQPRVHGGSGGGQYFLYHRTQTDFQYCSRQF